MKKSYLVQYFFLKMTILYTLYSKIMNLYILNSHLEKNIIIFLKKIKQRNNRTLFT